MDSILLSVKKMLGIEPDYKVFDQEIIMHINSVLMILEQLGVGQNAPFYISGEDETWGAFLSDDIHFLELVKSYIYLKVRLIFDPPTTGVLHEAMERQVKEFEWRLLVQADELKRKPSEGVDEDG